MRFKVLKASFAGIYGGNSDYATIDEVIADVNYNQIGDSRGATHEAIRTWATDARPGDIYYTHGKAIVRVAVDAIVADEECPYCGCAGPGL